MRSNGRLGRGKREAEADSDGRYDGSAQQVPSRPVAGRPLQWTSLDDQTRAHVSLRNVLPDTVSEAQPHYRNAGLLDYTRVMLNAHPELLLRIYPCTRPRRRQS